MRGGKARAGGVPDRRVGVAHHPTRVGHAGAGDGRRCTRGRLESRAAHCDWPLLTVPAQGVPVEPFGNRSLPGTSRGVIRPIHPKNLPILLVDTGRGGATAVRHGEEGSEQNACSGGKFEVPPAGFEPAHPVPEAGDLSACSPW